ncbi:MAG: leucine--tRNA ligase [Chlamydiia bacterium]|nr:leucine--tRNA ligase [Chlamydiia bacterium]
MKYDHQTTEKKWQAHWEKNKTFKSVIDKNKPKYYVLDMFPYPSGSGLHVGHVEGYTATDILARFKRKKGFSVLHPMGWDSFGLPAEQYAIRTGTHPAETTEINIANFRRQLKSLGFSYDWDREFATSDPRYYKWTQWIFTKLFEKGLAYEAEVMVNYCPFLGTVLANEEVENGFAKEGGHPVEKRPLKQWILKITAYADRLIKDLDLLDWPESLKRHQKNWIGRSEGAWIDYQVEGLDEKLTVFTTRADTIFGVTYMAIAPEHPLVKKLPQNDDVDDYVLKASQKSDLERTDLAKTKSGVFTGVYAVCSATGRKIPIWVADYILMGYGTGAIMAVPAHDERDKEFAEKFNIDIIPVYDEDEKVINSSNKAVSLNGLEIEEAKKKAIEWLEVSGHGRKAVTYKLRDWLFSRQRYWGEPFPILHFEDGSKRVLEEDELPLTPPDLSDFKPAGDGKSPLSKVKDWVEITDPKTGKKALRETNTMPQWAGSCWYYLRFADPQNDEKPFSEEAEKYWLPVDMYVGGVEHAVLHLLYARFWHKVLYDCGLVSTLEPFQTLRNQGLIVARSFQRETGAYVPPEEVKETPDGFFDKNSGEPLRSQVEKMSKSKLNGVTPDDCIQEFGADALRMYEMFMGPLEKEKIWNTDAIAGSKRFLNRVYDIATSEKVTEEENSEADKLAHKMLNGVMEDTEALMFNTAIAKMMEFLNDFSKLSAYPKSAIRMLAHALSPYAPHLADEVWELMGGQTELAHACYPEIDKSLLKQDVVTYVVQVNGKLRGRFDLPLGAPEEEIAKLAQDHPVVQPHLDGKTIVKQVFVPNKLINFVVK